MKLLLSSGVIGGIIGGVVALVVLIIIIWAIAVHNKFVALRNQYEEAFHNIDIYCKKRYDLIPNLVETVKGYTKHESSTLEKVIQARS
ncbi:MAG: LemA family protein, partial [Clostridia bacterium]|nr:LemA family protein [Clostridia bacterium]